LLDRCKPYVENGGVTLIADHSRADNAARNDATDGANRRKAILVVDDEPYITILVKDTLSDLGYRVWVASDGASALQVWDSAGVLFDLLLADVVLPDRSGPVLARQLRSARPELRVVFMSGYATKEMELEAKLEEGELLTKPFSPDVLAETVARMFDSSSVVK
jgi:two-component system cell cycle sensor histidine kinase/response regulator CckA